MLIARDAWGQGFAREAMAAVLQRAFAVHRLAHVVADIDPLNVASQRLFAALGSVETGRAARTFLIEGVWHDSVYLRLTPDGLALAPSRSCR